MVFCGKCYCDIDLWPFLSWPAYVESLKTCSCIIVNVIVTVYLALVTKSVISGISSCQDQATRKFKGHYILLFSCDGFQGHCHHALRIGDLKLIVITYLKIKFDGHFLALWTRLSVDKKQTYKSTSQHLQSCMLPCIFENNIFSPNDNRPYCFHIIMTLFNYSVNDKLLKMIFFNRELLQVSVLLLEFSYLFWNMNILEITFRSSSCRYIRSEIVLDLIKVSNDIKYHW